MIKSNVNWCEATLSLHPLSVSIHIIHCRTINAADDKVLPKTLQGMFQNVWYVLDSKTPLTSRAWRTVQTSLFFCNRSVGIETSLRSEIPWPFLPVWRLKRQLSGSVRVTRKPRIANLLIWRKNGWLGVILSNLWRSSEPGLQERAGSWGPCSDGLSGWQKWHAQNVLSFQEMKCYIT